MCAIWKANKISNIILSRCFNNCRNQTTLNKSQMTQKAWKRESERKRVREREGNKLFRVEQTTLRMNDYFHHIKISYRQYSRSLCTNHSKKFQAESVRPFCTSLTWLLSILYCCIEYHWDSARCFIRNLRIYEQSNSIKRRPTNHFLFLYLARSHPCGSSYSSSISGSVRFVRTLRSIIYAFEERRRHRKCANWKKTVEREWERGLGELTNQK